MSASRNNVHGLPSSIPISYERRAAFSKGYSFMTKTFAIGTCSQTNWRHNSSVRSPALRITTVTSVQTSTFLATCAIPDRLVSLAGGFRRSQELHSGVSAKYQRVVFASPVNERISKRFDRVFIAGEN